MKKRIFQKRFFDQREYTLEDDCVKTKVKDFRQVYETDIEYDRIIGNRNRIVEGSITTYVIMRISFVLMFLALLANDWIEWIDYRHAVIFGAIGLVTLIVYFISRKDFTKIKVTGDQFIYIHKKIPSENEVNNFIDSMMESRDSYLKTKFLKFDKLISYEEQKKNLRMLKDFHVLNQNEYDSEEHKLKELFGNVEKSDNPIGFRINNT